MLVIVLVGAVMSQRAPRVAAEPLPPTPAWQITCVDCPKLFGELTDRGLRLDFAGHPHIAYGGDHLYYATHDGSAWRYETVDSSSAVGSAASLALDAAGRPAISYYDALNQDLKFAYRDGSGWHTQTVDSGGPGGDVGMTTALGLDANGRAHIAYSDGTHQSVKYARRGTSGWQLEPIGAANWQVAVISLAVDSAGNPHVSYYAHYLDSSGDDLVYARRGAAGWTVETAVANAGYLWSCSLALDRFDRPHIAYPASGRQSAIAHWTGSAWQIETMTWRGDNPAGLSLAIGADGFPQVSAMVIMQYEPTSWIVEHQYKDAAGWHSTGGYSRRYGQTSLALDASGRPYVGHAEGDTLVLSSLAGAAWQSQQVDVSRNAGKLTSLAMDSSSRPVIAYWPGKIAAWTGGSWAFDDFRPSGEPTGLALALSSDGQPRVAYSWHWSMDIFEENGLDFVERSAAGWQRTALYGGGVWVAIGAPALALDAADAPQIASGIYNEVSPPGGPPYSPPYSIVHFGRTPSGWARAPVDEPGYSDDPPRVSLALNQEGHPIVAYTAPSGNTLKVASNSASGWQIEIVDPAGGGDMSLALDAAGRPRMSYVGAGQLKYATRDPGGWRVVNAAAGNFAQTSLALDASGYAHISAYDPANADLVYAWQDAAGWHVEVVDSQGAVGQGNSLALTAAGQALISYYDASNGDLKLAVRQLPKAGAAAHANVPPTVDGDLADWPALPGVPVDTWNAVDHGGLISGTDDASARCFHQWTATHLYAACRVDDDALVADSGAQWWKDDTLELVYDGLNDNQSYGADDHKYELRIEGGFSDYTAPAHPAVAFALRLRPGGYSMELAIPAAQLGASPMQAGRVIGLNIGLIDDDTGGDAEGWLGWSGNTWRRADLCGDLLLLPPGSEASRGYLPLILRR